MQEQDTTSSDSDQLLDVEEDLSVLRRCTKCGQLLPLTEFYQYSPGCVKRAGRRHRQCRECMRTYHRGWNAQNRSDPEWVEHQKAVAREWKLKRDEANPGWNADHRLLRRSYKYGLSVKDLKQLLEQQRHRCAACGRRFSDARFSRPAVDHDHQTGAIRGLLCTRCNTVLGQAGDSPRVLRALITYLKREVVNRQLALKE